MMISSEIYFSSLHTQADLFCNQNYFYIVDSKLLLILAQLKAEDKKVIVLDGGEQVKTREKKAWLEDKLLKMGCDSESTLVAIGGGTLLDLVGFVAATLFRGIGFISCPSTLLAMVDAAVGGKNGVNVHGYKNVLGTVYHPQKIIIDLTLLDTLADEEIENGLAECFKHALLESRARFFTFVLQIEKMKQRDKKVLRDEVEANIAFKRGVVAQSIQNQKRRDLLNFGHTVGHALEALEEGKISHGKAISLGMLLECKLSMILGHMNESEYKTIKEQLQLHLTLPTLTRTYTYEEWMKALCVDKKKKEGKVCSVLLQSVGLPLILEERCSHPILEQQWADLLNLKMAVGCQFSITDQLPFLG